MNRKFVDGVLKGKEWILVSVFRRRHEVGLCIMFEHDVPVADILRSLISDSAIHEDRHYPEHAKQNTDSATFPSTSEII